jgi:hypothetical protein
MGHIDTYTCVYITCVTLATGIADVVYPALQRGTASTAAKWRAIGKLAAILEQKLILTARVHPEARAVSVLPFS